jgi:hypothetical protein
VESFLVEKTINQNFEDMGVLNYRSSITLVSIENPDGAIRHLRETKDSGYRNTKLVSTLSTLECDAAELEFGEIRRSANSRFWG